MNDKHDPRHGSATPPPMGTRARVAHLLALLPERIAEPIQSAADAYAQHSGSKDAVKLDATDRRYSTMACDAATAPDDRKLPPVGSVARVCELVGQYGVQVSETKVLAPRRELIEAIEACARPASAQFSLDDHDTLREMIAAFKAAGDDKAELPVFPFASAEATRHNERTAKDAQALYELNRQQAPGPASVYAWTGDGVTVRVICDTITLDAGHRALIRALHSILTA